MPENNVARPAGGTRTTTSQPPSPPNQQEQPQPQPLSSHQHCHNPYSFNQPNRCGHGRRRSSKPSPLVTCCLPWPLVFVVVVGLYSVGVVYVLVWICQRCSSWFWCFSNNNDDDDDDKDLFLEDWTGLQLTTTSLENQDQEH